MKLPRALANNGGFTLVEIMVVIGLLGLIGVFGLLISMDFYRSYSFNYERDMVISLLQKSRSRAMANINQSAHGFCWDGDSYIVFEGSLCPVTGGEEIPKSANVTLTGDVVTFDQLSGKPNTGGTITVTSQGKTATITINNEGAIIY